MTTRTRDYLLRKLEKRSRGTARKGGAPEANAQRCNLDPHRSDIEVWVDGRWLPMEIARHADPEDR